MDKTDAKKLYTEYLKEIMYSEQEAADMIAEAVKMAESPLLQEALEMADDYIQPKIDRLTDLFSAIGEEVSTEKDRVTDEIISDGREKTEKTKDATLKDIAIAGGIIRLSHYLMACYEVTAVMAELNGQKVSATELMKAMGETYAYAQKYGALTMILASDEIKTLG